MGQTAAMSEPTVHRTFCRFCIAYCGALVSVDEEQTVLDVRGDPDHPTSRGYLCAKGRALGINQHDPRRLGQPLLGRGADRRKRAAPDIEAREVAAACPSEHLVVSVATSAEG